MSSNTLLHKQLQNMLPCCWTCKRLVLQQESGAWHCLQDHDPNRNHLNQQLCVSLFVMYCMMYCVMYCVKQDLRQRNSMQHLNFGVVMTLDFKKDCSTVKCSSNLCSDACLCTKTHLQQCFLDHGFSLCKHESQLHYLWSYFGHVIEGAKCDKSIQQRWQWGHLWSIYTAAHYSSVT